MRFEAKRRIVCDFRQVSVPVLFVADAYRFSPIIARMIGYSDNETLDAQPLSALDQNPSNKRTLHQSPRVSAESDDARPDRVGSDGPLPSPAMMPSTMLKYRLRFVCDESRNVPSIFP
jgi:hypothetical protein